MLKKQMLVAIALAMTIEGGSAMGIKAVGGHAVQELNANCETWAKTGKCCKSKSKFNLMKGTCFDECVKYGAEHDNKFYKPMPWKDDLKCGAYYYRQVAESLEEDKSCGDKVLDGTCLVKIDGDASTGTAASVDANMEMVEECPKTCIELDPAIKPFFPAPPKTTTTTATPTTTTTTATPTTKKGGVTDGCASNDECDTGLACFGGMCDVQ